MTAPVDQVSRIAGRLSSVVERALLEEMEKLRVPAPRVQMLKPDAEVMKACRRVALSYDALAQAKFAGQREAGARMALERAAKSLARVMRMQGRLD